MEFTGSMHQLATLAVLIMAMTRMHGLHTKPSHHQDILRSIHTCAYPQIATCSSFQPLVQPPHTHLTSHFTLSL